MTFYVLIFAVLWVALLVSVIKGKAPIFIEIIALTVFVLVAGQRFETGNDWLVYRDHYVAIQNFGLLGGEGEEFPRFEPFYVLLVYVVGALFDFQTFLLLVAVFNGVVLFRFSKVWGSNFVGVAAIYYAWLYLATQMATTRYSIAISFVLLALLAFFESKRWLTYVLLLVATGFHVFSLAFFPLFFFFRRGLSLLLALLLLVAGSVVVGLFLFAVGAGYLSWMPFAEKVALYADVATVGSASAGSVAYIVLNLLFFFWLMTAFDGGIRTRVAQWSVFYLLFYQIVLWMLPVFWGRVQVFVLIVQACVLAGYLVRRRSVFEVLVVGVLSLAMLVKLVIDPAFVSYIPYQSYWFDKLFADTAREDGEDRFFEAINLNRERNSR